MGKNTETATKQKIKNFTNKDENYKYYTFIPVIINTVTINRYKYQILFSPVV